MRHGAVAFVSAIVAVASGVTRAQAEPVSDDGPIDPLGIPAGYEHFEIDDLSFTLRDDAFSTITADPNDPKTAYVGSFQGRFYKTTDTGKTWTESTIIPEQKRLWATAGSSIFFGGIRDSPSSVPPVDILWGLDPQFSRGDPPPGSGEESPQDSHNPFLSASSIAAGAGSSFLGVGLSSRSPRLSLLVGSRGRPTPVLSRQTLLGSRILRGTTVDRITVDPTDPRLLFATTNNGLYKSYDGGTSWARTFAGFTPAERHAVIVAIRPKEPHLTILGTATGAYTSTDQGENWSKITTVGGFVNEVAFDSEDANNVYLATSGGVMRSTDGAKSFLPIYYSTYPAEGDVRTIVIDPFDMDTAYIGTGRGAFVTHKLRTASFGDWAPLAGVQSSLQVLRLAVCSKHKGHIYAMTRIDLATINYGADAPESAILESWDGGGSWRQLFRGQSNGFAESFVVDSKDPDQLWIVWSTALHRLERGVKRRRLPAASDDEDQRWGPPMGEVMLAALSYHGVELDAYAKKINHTWTRSLVPQSMTIRGDAFQWSRGYRQDDNQFAAGRYLAVGDAKEWSVIAYASWDFADAVYSRDAVPLLRQRITQVNDELRGHLIQTILRNYGELRRIHEMLEASPPDLRTRLIYQLRIEQLEATVDVTSGGYLTRWQKNHRRTDK